MISFRLPKTGLVCATLAILAGGASQAQADNLFDMLFGGGNRAASNARVEPMRGVAPAKPVRRKPARVATPKISAPSYYNYKPAEPVHIDFARIAPAVPEAAFGSMLVGAAFRESLPDLAGFELFAEKGIAEALIEYYSKNPDFIWVSGHQANARAEQALRVLAEAGQFGLSEADYTVGVPSTDFQHDQIAERQKQLIRFEMTLSARVLRYARDAYQGRIDPNKLSGYHDLPEKPLDLTQSLGFMARVSDVDIYLKLQHPQNSDYRALRAELETLRAGAEREIVVDPKTFVRPGGSNPEFAKLLKIIERDGDADFLAEFGPLLKSHAGSHLYADELTPLIKAAQEKRGLKPDGVIGPRTVSAMAGESKAARIEKVLLALERLRWHPSDLGETRVVINAASFKVDFFDKENLRLSMRTVVGSRSNQTNFFHDKLETVEFNPYWGVPRSILVNEMLPKLLRDSSYLDRNGYEVVSASGRQVSSTAVNWGQYGSKIPFNVRQKPGPRNSLGELKILFPNRHAIYMHDTPSKSLFQRDTRAFSHGCVRLADPRAMAAAVLDISVEEVAASINRDGGKTTRRKIERDIPVYVGYFTAWPDAEADGKIAYHGDVYQRDERLKIALEKVADTRAPSS